MASEGKAGSKKLIFIILAAVIVIAAIVVIIFLRKGGISATTMRLLRMQGTVTLEDEGAYKTITENLRLKSGNALNTGTESLASIGLDDTKIITLDELSRAEFNQSGKKLDLELTEGQLFFEVSKALEADESLNIATSTMVVGIRGTSGWVTVTKDGNWSIVVTDGHVHVTGTNPETGETKETEVYAGQRCIVYLYDRETDSVMFTLEDVSEDEIPEFVLAILRSNPALLDKVCEATGWSKPVILGETEDETGDETGDNGNGESSQNTQPGSGSGDEGNTGNDDGNGDETGQAEEEEETVKVAGTAKERVQEYIAYEYPTSGNILVTNGDLFDPVYYANRYPDVASAVGNDKYALLEHYLRFGEKEGRSPNQLDEEAKLAKLYEEEHKNDNQQSSGNTNTNQNANVLGAANSSYIQSGTYDAASGAYILRDSNGNVLGQFDIGGNDSLLAESGTYRTTFYTTNLIGGNRNGYNIGISEDNLNIKPGAVVVVDATNDTHASPSQALRIMEESGAGSQLTDNYGTYTKNSNGSVTSTINSTWGIYSALDSSYSKPSSYTMRYTGSSQGAAATGSTANISVAPDATQGGKSTITVTGYGHDQSGNVIPVTKTGTIDTQYANVSNPQTGGVVIQTDEGDTIFIDDTGFIS